MYNPELGQVVFGIAYSEYEADGYCSGINLLVNKIQSIRGEQYASYFYEFDNGTFVVRPYSWEKCECHFLTKENNWQKKNKHSDDCFNTRYRKYYDDLINYIKEPELISYTFYEIRDKLITWAKENGSDNHGMAIRCTCEYKNRYNEWKKMNDHADKCIPYLPNFKHYTTGFEIRFYKGIRYGMQCNTNIHYDKWKCIVDECLLSLIKPLYCGRCLKYECRLHKIVK